MAGRPKKAGTIKDEILKQEEAVAKSKARYDAEVKKLKDLYAKQDEMKKKSCLRQLKRAQNHTRRSWHF